MFAYKVVVFLPFVLVSFGSRANDLFFLFFFFFTSVRVLFLFYISISVIKLGSFLNFRPICLLFYCFYNFLG